MGKTVAVDHESLHWTPAGDGYDLALDGDKLICRNKKGKVLGSVPKAVREGDAAEGLVELRDWLNEHRRACRDTVESWLVRSLPVPRGILEAVWADPAWRTQLENAVVAPAELDGRLDLDRAGFLRGTDAGKGAGVVDLDGETGWIDAELLGIPHPILLPELESFRELAGELALTQGLQQLFRETFARPADADLADNAIRDFASGKFAQQTHVVGRCRSLGYRVRGAYATCPIWEDGQLVEARYWIGDDDPFSEAWTGALGWTDEKGGAIPIGKVGPVAYSEGVRMASAIYAGRVVEKEAE